MSGPKSSEIPLLTMVEEQIPMLTIPREDTTERGQQQQQLGFAQPRYNDDDDSITRNPCKLHRKQSLSNLAKTVVHVAVAFLKIGEIDTVKELYSADLYIQAHWREPLLDGKTPEELKNTDLRKLWNPHLYIENEMTERKGMTSFKVNHNEQGEAFITERRKVRGDYLENLELQHFPLDVQDLSIKIVTDLPDTEVDLVPDEEEISSVNTATFADKQEWKLFEHVDVAKTIKVITGHSNLRIQHSALLFTCRAARRAGFFCYNTFFVMFLISLMSFGTFAVDCNLPQNRIQLTFTLVLTFIAYKMAVNQSLPRISYLTYMDKYVLMSLTFLVLIAGWHALASKLCVDKSEGSFYKTKTEYWIIFGFVLLYIFEHAIFAALLYVHALKRRIQMTHKDREFRRRIVGKTMAHHIANVKRGSI